MKNPPHSKYAGWFLLVGIVVTYGLMFLMTAQSPFSGWGDGAGHFDKPSPEWLVLPYSSYFLCGVVAACSTQRRNRIIAAIIGHLAPLLSFAFTTRKEVPFFVGLELVAFVAFGFAWFDMLRKQF
jgi:hypothetical protein